MENILTSVWAKHNQFSVPWCSMWQLWAIVMCAPCWPTPAWWTRQSNLTLGSVIKKWFSCQRNQPFQEDVSYCISCLFVIIPTLFQSKTPFSDPPMSCRTLCWPPNCHWLVTVLLQGNVRLQLFFTAFLMLVGRVVGWWQNCGNRSELLHQAKV